ncbi:hypothetical protein [Amycolatopsis panacis]|uniref:hypothetical protein n=1 Tax=Amycolatopsis panacis TaxID=2340917 RepID=UPI0013141DD5|nr:hypothetical protein [Amycolatopsis panacis]
MLLNRGGSAATITTTARELGLSGKHFRARDLWSGTTSSTTGTLRANVPSHGSTVLRIWPVKAPR